MMGEDIITFKGHHGTSSQNSKSIRTNGFNVSNSGWLGKGVYFFDDDKDMARNWAIYKGRGLAGKIEVIECNINVMHTKLLDIVDPKSEQSKKVNEIRENFLKATLNRNKLINIDDNMLDGKFFDMICEMEGISVVRNSTHTLTQEDRRLGIKFSNISNGVELCVRDMNTIDII